MSRVMIIDNTPEGEALKGALERDGYEIVLTRDGGTVLWWLCGRGIDLVLINCEMANMYGIEFAGFILNRYPHLQSLLMFTDPTSATAEEVRANGLSTVGKNPEDVSAAISVLLGA